MNVYLPQNGGGQSEPSENKINKIRYLTWKENAYLPAGTYIEIWGVRANA